MTNPSQAGIAILTVVLAGLIYLIFGAIALPIQICLAGGFALYWRSGKFRWPVVFGFVAIVAGVLLALFIAFTVIFAGYGTGWEY